MTVADMCTELWICSVSRSTAGGELSVDRECIKIPNGELRAWQRDFLASLESLRERAA
jgi:hypothetical protein